MRLPHLFAIVGFACFLPLSFGADTKTAKPEPLSKVSVSSAKPDEKLTELEDAKIKNFRLQHQLNLDAKQRLEEQYGRLQQSDAELTAEAKKVFEEIGKTHGLTDYTFNAEKFELTPPQKTESPKPAAK
jgi:hypothetical protein